MSSFGCTRCQRQGQYRLARLADKYGSEMELSRLIGHLAGDCKYRDVTRHIYDFCGAYYVDTGRPRPPDHPPPMMRLKVVK